MKIYLARHGRTNYNDRGLCNADPTVDVHLTPTGVKQAESLAKKLKDIPIEHIFASELKRTLQTAEIVNQFHDLKIEIDPRLNDGRSGFEGMHFEEYERALNATSDRWTARFNGGESIEDIRKRVADFVDALQAKKYDTVLIITSAWIVQAMLSVIQNIPLEEAWGTEVIQGDYTDLEL